MHLDNSKIQFTEKDKTNPKLVQELQEVADCHGFTAGLDTADQWGSTKASHLQPGMTTPGMAMPAAPTISAGSSVSLHYLVCNKGMKYCQPEKTKIKSTYI